MPTRKNATLPTWVDPDDAPELTDEMLERAEISIGEHVIRKGRPPSGKAKQLVTLRLDPDVLQALRDLGPGWQTRAAEALRHMAMQPPGPKADARAKPPRRSAPATERKAG